MTQRERSEATASRDEQIAQWWREGLSRKEIATRLGWSLGRLSNEIKRMRERGYELERRDA